MFKKIFIWGALIFGTVSPSFGMTSELHEVAEEPARQSTFKDAARNLAARLYYATAVTGHGSDGPLSNPFFMLQLYTKKVLGPDARQFFQDTEGFPDEVVEEIYKKKESQKFHRKDYRPEEWKKNRTLSGYRVIKTDQMPKYFFISDSYNMLQKEEYVPEPAGTAPKIILSATERAMPFDTGAPAHRMVSALQELMKTHATMPFEVHSTQHSGGILGLSGHLSYVMLHIDAVHGTLHTQVMDPVTKALGYIFPGDFKQSLAYHTELARALGLELKHTYRYAGNQVFNNMDCGRFSTIYLLNAFHGRAPEDLSAYDIYRGFKILQENGYDEFAELNWFGRIVCGANGLVGWLNRKVADLFIGALEEKEKVE